MNPFLASLGTDLADAAGRRQLVIDPPELDEDVGPTVLDLARVVAHTHQRSYAPLACFLAGIAVERMRGAGAVTTAELDVAYLNEIIQKVEESP